MATPAKTGCAAARRRLQAACHGLTEAGCRWPVGDPLDVGFRFCLAPQRPGSPYCPVHHGIAFRKGGRPVLVGDGVTG
jgi:hypothetical protein